MADKYLKQNVGYLEEVEGLVTSVGATDAGKIPALDATGRLTNSVMPIGYGDETKLLTAYENISAGQWVNIFLDGGVAKIRKADATTIGKEADGFILVGVTTGNTVLTYQEGYNTQCAGLTIGATYYLDTTAGGITATPPSATGNVVQSVGKAVSATEIAFKRGCPIKLA